MRMIGRVSLRLRFGVAAALLVCTTVLASGWTLAALWRLSGVVTDTVHDSEAVTAVTSKLAGALEREDDAVLLIVAGDAQGSAALTRERRVVDGAVSDLFEVLGPADEQELATPLASALQAYRRAADAVASRALDHEALAKYHQQANPLLRRAVGLTTTIRDRHFELARGAVTRAQTAARGSQRAVLLITLGALGVAMLVAWHLTRRVVTPLRRLTRGANAIREGRFDERIEVASADELGELASAFNKLAKDLTEFRRTNIGEVVQAKNTLEATLEALPDAVVLLDADARILSMNEAALEICAAAGVPAPATLGDLRLEGLDPDRLWNALEDRPHSGRVADLSRTIHVCREGASRRLLPRLVPVPGLTPQRGGAILLLYDVTDLARLDEMRSEVVAVASHELQTPLTTLRMTLLMLQEAAAGLPTRERELVATSLIGVEQLAETVHEFLDLTRIEAGELRLNLEPVDLGALLKEVISHAAPQASARDTRVRATIAPNLPVVTGDARRLRVVFDNILSNALKYTPAGGLVSLDATEGAGDADTRIISISVSDTGPGVPAPYRDRIFDKFFRLEHQQMGDSRRTPRGAGIGLYMSRQIVELHGGRVFCAAGMNDCGARITVHIPASDLTATRARDTAMAMEGRRL